MSAVLPVRWLLAVSPALAGTLLLAEQLFFLPNHDWDMDAFLYLGSRLLKGELLYAKDFETKLPLLQYLFAPAMAMGGIGAWRIINAILVAGFAVSASIILAADMERRAGPSALGRHELALVLFGSFFLLAYSLPGASSSHIEMVAAAGAYLSLALVIAQARARKPSLFLFIAGLALSFASLVRPNYVFLAPVLLTVPVFAWRRDVPKRQLLIRLAWFPAGFAAMAIFVFLPYAAIPGGIDILAEGLRALASFSQGTAASELLGAQFLLPETVMFYAVLYCLCMAAAPMLLLGGPALRNLRILAVLGVLTVVALNASLIRTHYWPHNSILFVPCIPLLLLFLWKAAEATSRTPREARVASAMSGGIVLLTLAVLSTAQVWRFVSHAGDFDSHINQRHIDPPLRDFLAAQQAKGRSFLSVDEPIYHALLGESRIGDGHPSMLTAALKRAGVGPIPHIPLFAGSGTEAACRAVLSARKDIVVLYADSRLSRLVADCIATEPDAYRVVHQRGDMLIILRNPT